MADSLLRAQAEEALRRVAGGGVPVQVEEESLLLRTERSKTFRRADGDFVTIARVDPLHYKDSSGVWQEYDLSIPASQRHAPGQVSAMDTYKSESADGRIWNINATYATARSTAGSAVTDAASSALGQNAAYNVSRLYFSFDTSAIGSTASPTAASAYFCAGIDGSTGDFNVSLYRRAWTEALGASANIEANYDMAYDASSVDEGVLRNTSAGWTAGTWYQMLLAASGINTTGDTKYIMVSDDDVNNTTPTASAFAGVRMSESTGYEPYLIVQWAQGVVGAWAAATATAFPVSVSTDQVLTMDCAAASASSLATGLAYDYSVLADIATATAAAFECGLPNVTIDLALAIADATAPILDVSGDANAIGALASATAAAFELGLSLGAGIDAVLASATATGLATDVYRDYVLYAALSSATATALATGLSVFALITVAIAEAIISNVTLAAAPASNVNAVDSTASNVSLTVWPV
jgi:hypothetical protein